jgi:Tol biopolymer transport system component
MVRVKRLAVWLAASAVGLAVSVVFGSMFVSPVSDAKTPGPNGRILYTFDTRGCDDCHLTTIDPDGTDRVAIPNAFASRWSPDGTRISTGGMTADGRISTVVMDADGSNRTALPIPDPTLNLACLVWFPDATRLLCEGWDDVHPHRRAGLFSVDATDGSDLARITTNPFGGHDIPADVSPDGRHLLFMREDPTRARRRIGLFVSDADGSNARQVGGWLNDSSCCEASWSPDGSTILFARNGHLRTIAPDGTGSAAIALDTGAGRAYAFAPGWSPDGTHLIFAMYLDTTGHVDIFTAAADGSDVVQLTDTRQEDGFPDWGPHPTVD